MSLKRVSAPVSGSTRQTKKPAVPNSEAVRHATTPWPPDHSPHMSATSARVDPRVVMPRSMACVVCPLVTENAAVQA